jgi:CheY-like chemotaxis protein
LGLDPPVVPVAVVLFVNGGHSEHIEALRIAGYRVEVAATALEALERGRSAEPDALIVPLLLPDMSGTALAHLMGGDGTRERTLAVVILASGDAEVASRGVLQSSGLAFCKLPCTPADLVRVMGEQLSARRALRGGGTPSPTTGSEPS